MKVMKKLTAMVLVMILVMSMLVSCEVLNQHDADTSTTEPTETLSETQTHMEAETRIVTSDGVELSLNEDGSAYRVTGYTGEACVVEIPSAYNGIPVTAIGEEAFARKLGIYSLTIPESVTEIADNAFPGCFNLMEVINRSSLDIVAGGAQHGQVSGYALEVHSLDSKLVNADDYLFYTYDGTHYLC